MVVPNRVGIVIVSHSDKIAQGTKEMVEQMVGNQVALACCGGNPAGGLGTDVAAIYQGITDVFSEAGVAVLVDLGGAEMNAEMAIELLKPEEQSRVVICEAPIVEGAIMAATEASVGSSLAEVKEAAESAL